ncbi:MAG: S8 family serine peptidase [Anaerolineae bacterium]|nr:S8 family serine peptidase [Anaerolineae bacterium]
MSRFLVLVVLSLALLLAAVAGPTAVAQSSTTIFLPAVTSQTGVDALQAVRLRPQDYAAAADQLHPSLVIDYGSFIWLILPSRDVAMLQAQGILVTQQEATFELLLNRFRFDPLEGEPELPPDQQTSYEPGEAGFFLVQFAGPTRDEWLAELEAAGALILQFQPSFAYIVRMTPEEAVAVEALPFVRWVGVYHAAYRIAPSLLAREPIPGPAAPLQLIQNVDLSLFTGEGVEADLDAIRGLGGEIIQEYPAAPEDPFLTIIASLPFESLAEVAQLSTVLWMNFSSPTPGFDDEVSAQIVAGNHTAGTPFTGYQTWLANTGFDGTGVTVAVVDTGMDTNANATAHADIAGRIAAFVGYAGAPATDTNGHGTHVGGVVAGNASLGTTDANGFLLGQGMAPGAQLVVQNALLGAAWPPAGGWQQLSQDSVTNGAVASNNSWFTGAGGAQGYSMAARTHDLMVGDADFATAAAAESLIMVFSAGNSGPGASTITEPKEAKNLIVVGAAENLRNDPWVTPIGCGTPTNINNMANFSSRGPALDGRILPHVTAPGTYVASLRSATGSFGGGSCSGVIDANYVWFSGTSQAAPHATGAVALITEWWRSFNAGVDPSPAMAKALLINGADDMDTADIPNNNEGWGRINVDNVVNPAQPALYWDQTTIFGATGDDWTVAVGPSDPTQPVRISLVWADAPGAGSGGNTAAWVNDLDLTVSRGTTLFRGNVFSNGWSSTGGAADSQNNVENVYIQNPADGYFVTVSAVNIAADGVPYNGDTTDQHFALVCSNCVEATDLSITKSDNPDPAVAGETLDYTLTVTNEGDIAATNVEVVDVLPAGVTYLSDDAGCMQGPPGTLTCNLGSMAPGAVEVIQITVLIDADLVYNAGGPTTITNNATVEDLAGPDPDPANDTVSEDTLVVAEADLEIVSFEAVDPPAQVLVGEDVDITLRKVFTNNGPSAPMDVEVTQTATAPPDATVTPTMAVSTEAALALNELRELFEVFTINCGAASHHTFIFENEIQPLDPADTDPDQSNNTATVELDIECVVPVALNIKPGSFPNSINPDSRDVIPLAILTTTAGEYGLPLAFDATTIDPLSVRFGPPDEVWNETGGAFEAHNRGHIEDSRELDESTRDGDLDMVLHFHVRETGIGPGDTEACVKGQWVDGNGDPHTFFGCDSVRIVPSALP